MKIEEDILQIKALIENEEEFADKSKKASDWSRQYTMDVFENEIKKVLQS